MWNVQTELAGEHVVSADVAGRRHVALTRRAADNHEVLEDLARRVRLDVADGRRIAAVDADAQIDDAVRAERQDRLAGLRVQLLQQAVHREDEPLVAAVAAFPVHDAAAAHAVHVLADPAFLAGLRVDGDERAVAPAAVDDAADDDRIAAGIAVRVRPRHLELIHVGLVDLLRREVARVVRTVAVSGPPLIVGRLRAGCAMEVPTAATTAASPNAVWKYRRFRDLIWDIPNSFCLIVFSSWLQALWFPAATFRTA